MGIHVTKLVAKHLGEMFKMVWEKFCSLVLKKRAQRIKFDHLGEKQQKVVFHLMKCTFFKKVQKGFGWFPFNVPNAWAILLAVYAQLFS